MSTSTQTKTHEPFVASADHPPNIAVSLEEFLEAFYPDPYEEIRVRTFAPKGAPDDEPRFLAVKRRITREGIECDEESIGKLRAFNETRGFYFVVNAGGDTDESITRFNAFFVENDKLSIAEQHAALDACPIRPSIRVETKKSVHGYWLRAGECGELEWRDIQERLIAYFDGDTSIKNPSRVMRLPTFNHVTYDKETRELAYKRVDVVEFFPERRYTAAEMRLAFPQVKEQPKPEWKASPGSTTGDYSASWPDLLHELRQRIKAVATRNAAGKYEMKCPVHDGNGNTSLYCTEDGPVACLAKPPCKLADILIHFGLPAFPVKPDSFFKPKPPNHNGHAPERDSEPPEHEGDAQATTGDTAPDAAWNCTDTGNGYRFARQHGARIRYSYAAAKWFAFDGQRWLEDAGGEVHRRAKQTARNILIEAAHTEDENERKSKAKWAIASEANKRQKDMLSQAQCELEVELEAFDSERMLFNVANGTLDLRTGELRAHSLADMLTKITPINYDPNAGCPLWENFLFRIFGGNLETIRFIQRAVGYTLSGDTSEQCFFIGHGTGANGKSTFLDILKGLTGEYGQQTPTETLMVKKAGGSTSDVARLRGARFVAALETDSGQKLSEALIKQMTGSDTLAARFLYHEYFEFKPQFKLWLAANHKPGIGGTDEAIWRRVKLIPFEVTIAADERDPHMAERLREELPGILAWAVEGCLMWQAHGVGTCPAVERGTADYRSEMDVLAAFFTERCVVDKFSMVTAANLYAEYKVWCAEVGEEAQSQRWLGLRLTERGFKSSRKTDDGDKKTFWKGIGLDSAEKAGF